MYTYKNAKIIKAQLDKLFQDPITKAKILFEDTIITLITEEGDRELEESEKNIDLDTRDRVFNITLVNYKENGAIEACNYDDTFLDRLVIKN